MKNGGEKTEQILIAVFAKQTSCLFEENGMTLSHYLCGYVKTKKKGKGGGKTK